LDLPEDLLGMKNSDSQTEADSAQIINFRAVFNGIAFALHACRRRPRLVAGIAGSMFIVAVLVVSLMPKTYRVQCRLLAQKNPALAVRGDTMGEQATRSASDIVLRRENVINLMKRTNLVTEWFANRTFLQRVKDSVMSIFPQPTPEQKLSGLTDYVLTKLAVYHDETTVTFQADWRDPAMAFKLADAAQKSFLENKHVQEVATLAEAVSILQGRAHSVREEINKSVVELQALRERKQKEEKAGPREKEVPKEVPAEPAPTPQAARPKEPSEPPEVTLNRQRRLAELRPLIDTKERALAELEGSRLRRLNELQSKLQDLRAQYTEQHPAVTDVRQSIIGATKESPQATQFREELKRLRGEHDDLSRVNEGGAGRGRGAGLGRSPAVTPGGGLGAVIRIEQESAEERDPEIEYARSRLRFAITSYQALEDQIGKTEVDLKTAEAAFKYRYTLVTPPQMPRAPIAPRAVAISIAALLGGLLVGLLAAVFLERRDGVIYAEWQVEQGLPLRVLASVSPRALPPGPGRGRGR
jgi:uncharacterized protein involved in exopolysaccharide biosynthesis